ncbi:MAG TPA: sugar phosphate isomerase/epimerase [Phycisphaerae bacterium]|nr:sugar phosphate isomerase/epimerase [Phycisphaerae bacterium]
MKSDRRRVLGLVAGTCAAAAWGRAPLRADEPAERRPPAGALRLGLPTYMFKNYTLDQVIQTALRLDVKHLSLKSFHLPLEWSDDKVAAAVAKARDAGLTVYTAGVIQMFTQAEIDRGFAYARAASLDMIAVNPSEAMLDALEAKVCQTGIRVAIHNHGPDQKSWPTPLEIHARIRTRDKRIGICHDTGHTKRSGVDPVEATLKTADRILDFHLKDVDAATRAGRSVELGRGVVDIVALVRAIRKIGYAGVVGVEVEKRMDDLGPTLAESVGYVRGVAAAI